MAGNNIDIERSLMPSYYSAFVNFVLFFPHVRKSFDDKKALRQFHGFLFIGRIQGFSHLYMCFPSSDLIL